MKNKESKVVEIYPINLRSTGCTLVREEIDENSKDGWKFKSLSVTPATPFSTVGYAVFTRKIKQQKLPKIEKGILKFPKFKGTLEEAHAYIERLTDLLSKSIDGDGNVAG